MADTIDRSELELLEAMVLRATRYMPYRVLEDHMRYYAPARYLCGLTRPPGPRTTREGTRLINEYVVGRAVEEKLTNPKVLVADLTAQEAAITLPNEIGLMAGFMATVAAASQRAGAVLKQFAAGRPASLEREGARSAPR